jgi:hypothetical protein
MARAGLGVEDYEIEIMRYIDQVYGPELQQLLSAEMTGIWPEHDLDPGRAPTS